MKQQEARLYEGMYIISNQLNDEARAKLIEKLKADITKTGGVIKKTHDMKKKTLQYPIGRHKEGYYFLMYFTLEPAYIAELWRGYKLNEGIVRFMTMQTDHVLEDLKFKELPEA